MNKRIAAVFAAVALGVAGLSAVAPAQADTSQQAVASQVAAPQVAEKVLGTPWTGKKFSSRYICVQNNIGSTWDIAAASTAFESGSNTVVVENRGPGGTPCSSSYLSYQILNVGTYNTASAVCWNFSGPSVGGVYNGTATLAMNVNAVANVCRDTAQHRNNNISTGLGTAFGLAEFYSSTAYQASIMNTKFANSYNFAGADDRNSLFDLY